MPSDTHELEACGAVPALALGSTRLTPEDRTLLLSLARRSIAEATSGPAPPEVDMTRLDAKLLEPRACFVTLTHHGQLRGCIGHITAQVPLCRAVIQNAQSAARRDHRFAPVGSDELDDLEIEISVLTEPEPVSFSSEEELLSALHPHQDGVVLQIGDHRATYLPQVWAQLPEKTRFLDSLAKKAGCQASAWRSHGVTVSIYQVESFSEAKTSR